MGFYRRWIVANGWAEAAGLGTTFVLGRLAAPKLEQNFTAALLAILMGTALEGVLVGWAQERVLRWRVPCMPRWSWTVATAAGAAAAWTLGMIPSTIMASQPPGEAPAEPGRLLTLALAAALGLAAGPVLGAAQWIVLRRSAARARRWLWANALAWAAGMPIIFAGMDLVPWDGHPALMAMAVYTVCGVAGLAVGAIHGRILEDLISS